MGSISDIERNLKTDLGRFWDWAGMSPEQYAGNSGFGEWEVNYPGWKSLGTSFYNAVKAVGAGNVSKTLIDLMLDAIAIDNEVETLLKDCETELDIDILEFIIQCALTHIQNEARWQVASLIGRRQKKEWEKYLNVFIEDNDKYVQRRALIALSQINRDKAAEVAFRKIADEDEYIRLASLCILNEASPENLFEVLEFFKEDKSAMIQEKVNAIKTKFYCQDR